ncbi:MAG: phosphatidylserine decarboxylase family protein [Nitrospirae bacterium]|nr:phosphatidylserine decarboxylase family protein [Nitrospirota bacterium]
MYKSAPEGHPFIAVSGIITAGVFFAGPVYSVIPMLYFFRDPERSVPPGDVIISPADGRVIVIRDTTEDRYLHAEVKQISIFMSPLDVHVNRSPCDGRVIMVRHNKGRFLAAYKDEASLRNENIEMVLETRHGNILVRQVAGFVARRAVCRKAPGDLLKGGERYGIIKFSSRLDVYLPKDAMIKVKTGDIVRAGETILA